MVSISEESKPMVNIWSRTKTKCVNFIWLSSFAKHITMLLVIGNNFSYENKEIMIGDGGVNI